MKEYKVKILEPISKMALRAKSGEFRSETVAAGTNRIGNTMSAEKTVAAEIR